MNIEGEMLREKELFPQFISKMLHEFKKYLCETFKVALKFIL